MKKVGIIIVNTFNVRNRLPQEYVHHKHKYKNVQPKIDK